MTHEEFREKLKAISDSELAEQASSELSELCKTGGRSMTLSVPPRLTDTDMIFAELIRRFKLLTTN